MTIPQRILAFAIFAVSLYFVSRLTIAVLDAAIAREHDAGGVAKELKVLWAAVNSGLSPAIRSTLRNVHHKEVRDAVEAMLTATN